MGCWGVSNQPITCLCVQHLNQAYRNTERHIKVPHFWGGEENSIFWFKFHCEWFYGCIGSSNGVGDEPLSEPMITRCIHANKRHQAQSVKLYHHLEVSRCSYSYRKFFFHYWQFLTIPLAYIFIKVVVIIVIVSFFFIISNFLQSLSYTFYNKITV